jgi:hypothetical protein
MNQPLQWRLMSLREVRRTRKRQVGSKDPTGVEVTRRLAAEELRREGIDEALGAYEQRRLKKIKAWCRRRARRRREDATSEASAALLT